MFRLRLAAVIVAAGLGLACGCISLSHHPLLGRFRCHEATTDCCDEAALPACEGPMLEEYNPTLAGPGNQPIVPIPSLAPQNTVPQLSPPPRLVPQPQSQPVPYAPP